MEPTDLAQVILRGAHLISLLSIFGTLVSLAVVAPAALAEAGAAGKPARRCLVRLARWSTVLALATGFAWLVSQAALIAGANSAVDILHALPVVCSATGHGRS